MRIKKGDQVVVIAGKKQDKGKRGEVIKVLPKKNRVVVQGINLLTKHQRQVQAEGRTINPGIVKLEGPIDASNVMIICKKCNQPTRISISREGDKVMRVCKKCGGLID
ncbi:MAG: 50S ribosomal protein L24 [Pelolinea sp.]|nr:50S ribosomal protein L24 [Pelolinea sp.]